MLRDFVDSSSARRTPEVDGAQGMRLMRLLRRFYENRESLAEVPMVESARV
jgi:hypothetical protein